MPFYPHLPEAAVSGKGCGGSMEARKELVMPSDRNGIQSGASFKFIPSFPLSPFLCLLWMNSHACCWIPWFRFSWPLQLIFISLSSSNSLQVKGNEEVPWLLLLSNLAVNQRINWKFSHVSETFKLQLFFCWDYCPSISSAQLLFISLLHSPLRCLRWRSAKPLWLSQDSTAISQLDSCESSPYGIRANSCLPVQLSELLQQSTWELDSTVSSFDSS